MFMIFKIEDNTMKKRNCVIFLLVLIFAGCKGKGNTEIPKIKKRTVETIVERLQRKIKERTEHDLKKLGIKELLTNKNGKWSSDIFGGWVVFQNNGEVVIENRGRSTFYNWKVLHNTLYLTLPGLTIKYLKVTCP
jgi:hypothetical protein